MKVMIVPDIHLGVTSFGKNIDGKFNTRIQDQFSILNFIKDQAIIQKIDRMVLLGDIFDKEKPNELLLPPFIDWLSECTDTFNVDIILGNHDYRRSGTSVIETILDTIPAARIKNTRVIYKPTTINYDDLSITYIPFTDRDQLNFDSNQEATGHLSNLIQKELTLCPKDNYKIALGHMAIAGSFYVGNEIEHEYKELFLPIEAFSGYNYVWMGHVHKPQILSKSNPFVAMLGSMDRSSFSENEETKFICIYDSKTNDYCDIPLPCRSLIDIEIDVPENVTDTTDYVKQYIEKNANISEGAIVRTKIKLNSNNSESANRKEIKSFLENLKIQNVVDISEKKMMNTVIESAIDLSLLSKEEGELQKQQLQNESTKGNLEQEFIGENISPSKALAFFIDKACPKETEEKLNADVYSYCMDIVNGVIGK